MTYDLQSKTMTYKMYDLDKLTSNGLLLAERKTALTY